LLGVECVGPEVALAAVAGLLARGVIALPTGDDARVIALSPPLTIGRDALDFALDALAQELR
jgi:4-aminobutyrate aminotransferase-like enzyme